MEKSKREKREEAVKRLTDYKNDRNIYTCTVNAIVGNVFAETTNYEDIGLIIDLLTDDEDVCRCHGCVAIQRNNDLIELLKDASEEYADMERQAKNEEFARLMVAKKMESECMKLPVDADGEVIHLGDELQWDERDDGERLTVVGVGVDCVFYVDDDDVLFCGAQWTRASDKHHYRKPTIEDVLREFADEVQRCCDTEDTIAEYAKKLQLKEEVDED